MSVTDELRRDAERHAAPFDRATCPSRRPAARSSWRARTRGFGASDDTAADADVRRSIAHEDDVRGLVHPVDKGTLREVV